MTATPVERAARDDGAPVAELARHAATFLASGSWNRERLAAIAAESNHLPPRSLVNAKALGQPDTAAIVTGQQPAVGGGPLYTLIKTAHAIAMARALSAAGTPSVPVFWCASEDHDLGEAGHADLIRRDGAITRYANTLGGGRQSLRHRPARLWWDGLMATCREQLGPGLGADFLASHAPIHGGSGHGGDDGGEGMGAWLCRLLRSVFAAHGLVCLEAHTLRPLWPNALRAALERWPADGLARVRAAALVRGAADAFGELPEPPLFADRADAREKLTREQALELARTRPLDLSPGAPLRPILQQAALPAALYVGGPGELAYHAFLGPVYAAAGVQPPQLVPRCSMALAPSWWTRAVARWGIDPERIYADSEPPLLPDPGDPLDAPLDVLDHAIADVERAAEGREAVALRARRLRRDQRRLRAAIQTGLRKAASLPPFGQVRAWLYPRGQPQERVMSLFQALWEHGPGVGEVLVEAAGRLTPGEAGVVRLDVRQEGPETGF